VTFGLHKAIGLHSSSRMSSNSKVETQLENQLGDFEASLKLVPRPIVSKVRLYTVKLLLNAGSQINAGFSSNTEYYRPYTSYVIATPNTYSADC